MSSIFKTVLGLSTAVHAACAVGAVALFQLSKRKLDASYAASNHPVDYMTGQTGFSAEAVRGYYAHMQEAGTLDVYWTTQLIDYAFIAGMFCMGLFLCTFIARLGREDSRARRIGVVAGVLLMSGAVSDAIENGWSFIMLSDPSGFADWIAVVYSGFAVLKFALIMLGMLFLCLSIVMTVLGRVLGRPSLG